MYANTVKLRSRAGLIYTGKLHSIDTKHSTVTLKKVHLSNCNQGLPKEFEGCGFDYVIFRGGDIEDVELCLTIKGGSLTTHDSAIVRVNIRPENLRKADGLTNVKSTKKLQENLTSLANRDPAIVRIGISGQQYYDSFEQSKAHAPNSEENSQLKKKACEKVKEPMCLEGPKETRRAHSLDEKITGVERQRRYHSRGCSLEMDYRTASKSEDICKVCPAGDSLHNEASDVEKSTLIRTTAATAYDRRRSFFDKLSTCPPHHAPQKMQYTGLPASVDLRSMVNGSSVVDGYSRRIPYFNTPYGNDVSTLYNTAPPLYTSYDPQYTAYCQADWASSYGSCHRLSMQFDPMVNSPYYCDWSCMNPDAMNQLRYQPPVA
ncbi:unnamed protein product [Calicophoron daubneyi]|uniref:Lsm14-like N-terminal domain-containing protein n=1 Tax=Calicophoron daubneyi TaxID=300641 RepID=A0AAV2TEI7_CALDB